MDKEINNINIFGKLLPNKKFQKILLRISPATVQDYSMIKFGTSCRRKLFRTHSITMRESSSISGKLTLTIKNISSNSAKDTNNKIEK